LTSAQFRAHWSTAMVLQSPYTLRPVFATPVHQARPIAARDLADFFNRILLSIQSDGLIARPFGAIATVAIRPLQFLVLFLCHFEPSFCHPFIVRLCSEFSISLA
jgi:hypothetical protein